MEEPWAQQPGENALWYKRFTTYRHLGVKRSFLAVYNQERKKPSKGIPNSWRNAIKKFNWEERIKAWDAQQRVLDEDRFAAARDKAREARQTNILALTTLLGRVIVNEQKSAETKAKILGGKDPDKQIAVVKEAGISAKVLKDLATAASAIMKDSRIEFGEATDIQQLQGKGEDGAIEVKHGLTADERNSEIVALLNAARSRKDENAS